MARTRRPPVRAEENRSRVLTAAAEVIAERGFELTRYADIAQRADVSISTLQYLFRNLDGLLVQVVTLQARNYLDTARRTSEALADPVARLGWVIDHFVTADVSEADALADWRVWMEYWRAAARDPELRRDSYGAYKGWLEIVTDAVAAGEAANVFRSALPTHVIAQGILAMCDGFGIQIILQHSNTRRQDASQICRAWTATALNCPQLRRDWPA